MSCLLTSGISKGCRDNAGGIKRVLITNKEMIDTITPLESQLGLTASSDITGITMEHDPISGATYSFFEFIPNKLSSNYVENIQSNLQNDTVGYEQVLTLLFGKNNSTLRDQVKLMAQSELVAIIHDYRDSYKLLGEFNGLELSGGNSSSGTALSDMNGWTLTLTGYERYPARVVDSAVITSLGF